MTKTYNKNIHIPIAAFLNAIVTRIAGTTAWLNAILVIIILIQVTLRYGVKSDIDSLRSLVQYINELAVQFGFRSLLVPMEEIIWHIYAIAFMFGLSYAITTDAHIRVDILHHAFSVRTKRIVDILGVLFLLMPFLIIVFTHSIDWVQYAYKVGEASENPTGLPYRWIIKAVVPISLILMFIAALAQLITNIVLFIHGDKPINANTKDKSTICYIFSPQSKNCNNIK